MNNYFVEIKYRTRSGNCCSLTEEIEANNHDQAIIIAEDKVKKRRNFWKIDSSNAAIIFKGMPEPSIKVLVEIRGGNVIYTASTDQNVQVIIIDHDNRDTNREIAIPGINLFTNAEIDQYVSENGYPDRIATNSN